MFIVIIFILYLKLLSYGFSILLKIHILTLIIYIVRIFLIRNKSGSIFSAPLYTRGLDSFQLSISRD